MTTINHSADSYIKKFLGVVTVPFVCMVNSKLHFESTSQKDGESIVSKFVSSGFSLKS